MDVCLKVFASGVCSHPDNEVDKMHTCDYATHFDDGHRCKCGKAWTEVKCCLDIN